MLTDVPVNDPDETHGLKKKKDVKINEGYLGRGRGGVRVSGGGQKRSTEVDTMQIHIYMSQ